MELTTPNLPEYLEDFVGNFFLEPLKRENLCLGLADSLKNSIYRERLEPHIHETYRIVATSKDPLLLVVQFLMFVSIEKSVQNLIKDYYNNLRPNASPFTNCPTKEFVDLFIQIIIQETSRLRQYPYDVANIREYFRTYAQFFSDVWIKRDIIMLREKLNK